MNVSIPRDIDLDSSNVTEALYSEWLVGTTYSIGDKVYVTVEEDTSTEITPHKIYEALTAEAGNFPPDSTDDWLDLGGTNRWAMFDQFISSQTVNATSIEIVLNTQKADKLYLFNLYAEEVQIIVKDSVGATLSDETISLRSSSATGSWSEYFFDDIEYDTILNYDLPAMYLSLTVEVYINAFTSDNAKCGHCILGFSKELGDTQYGLNSSINDYSAKTTNSFGETEFVQRAFAKTMDFDLFISHDTDANEFDRIHSVLSSVRSTPVVWDANNESIDADAERQTFLIFGYYRKFNLIARYATVSQCNLRIEGLI